MSHHPSHNVRHHKFGSCKKRNKKCNCSMGEVQTKRKAILLLESDCDCQQPCKKRIVDYSAQSEVAVVQSLLQLRGGLHSLANASSRPALSLRPSSALYVPPSRACALVRTNNECLERRAVCPPRDDTYATISDDDDDDEQPTNLTAAKEANVTFTKASRTSFALAYLRHDLHPGRPLPPAPSFPGCLPPPPLATSSHAVMCRRIDYNEQ